MKSNAHCGQIKDFISKIESTKLSLHLLDYNTLETYDPLDIVINSTSMTILKYETSKQI